MGMVALIGFMVIAQAHHLNRIGTDKNLWVLTVSTLLTELVAVVVL